MKLEKRVYQEGIYGNREKNWKIKHPEIKKQGPKV
jgi:hypothetical protein